MHAAGVNPVDMAIRAGYLAGAYPHHFPIIPGWDVAGVVEAVGPAVVGFAPGDEVFGYVRRDDVQWGTAAELVPAPQRCLAHKPESLSFAEAGALPLAGLTAYQALTEALDVGEGDRVLVHRGRRRRRLLRRPDRRRARRARHRRRRARATTASCATPGAAEVLDYSAGPISEQLSEPVDAVLDLVGGDTLADAPEAGARPARRIAVVIDPAVRELGGRYVFVRPEQHDLEELGRMADAGQLRVPIAKAFPLEQIADGASAGRRGARARQGRRHAPMTTLEPPVDDADVPRYWRELGLPGLVDVHVHFLPEPVQAKVWQYFADGETHYGAAWPVAYALPVDERLAVLERLGVRAFPTLPYPHRPGMAAWLNDWSAEFAQRRPAGAAVGHLLSRAGGAGLRRRGAGRAARGCSRCTCRSAGSTRATRCSTPVWARLEETGTPVVIHCGSGPAARASTPDRSR